MGTKRALVVDDDAETVALFRKILTADHWEVESYTSGREALTKIHPEKFHLIVSDIHMPEMNGVEFYEKAVQADPGLEHKFLFVSGYTDSSAVSAFLLQTGCMGIRKPIRLEEFRAIVAHIGMAKPLETAALKGRWFTPDSQYLYSGEITGRHSTFSLLNRIYTARLTGVLAVQPGRVEKKLYFDFGNLIFASSNLPGDGLGEIMLREGALAQVMFDAATERMDRGERFGDALVSLGACTPQQLRDWIREQVTQIARSVFDYRGGRYYFFDTFGDANVPEVGIALPMGQFIMGGLREADDLPLTDLGADASLTVDLSPDPILRLQDVKLDENERLLMLKLTEPMPAQALLKASGISAEAAARALYALLALGMVMAVAPGTKRTEFTEFAPEPVPVAPPAPPSLRPPAVSPAVTAPAPKPAAGEPSRAAATLSAEMAAFESDLQKMLEVLEKGTHYQLLAVTANSDGGQIKKSYYTLARKFHPDRHMGRSEWIGSLQKLMEGLTTAYKTLSDEKARAKYDKGLAEGGAFVIGRGQTMKQETAAECMERAKECLRGRNYAGSITWLRKCVEIAPNESKYRAMLARSLAAIPTYRQEAIQHYEKALELDPFNTSAMFQCVELLEEMRLPWRAVSLLKRILDIDPDHAKAREKLKKLDTESLPKEKEQLTRSFLGKLFNR
jgi:CheY-like chemotaxis protein